jgi:uncharacterized protein
MSAMKLLVDRLGPTPQAFALEGDAAWWAEASRAGEWEPQLAGPVRFELEAYKMGEDVHVQGRAAAELECACSRCLARYRHALREAFRIVLEPAAGRVPADPEGAAALARDGMWIGDELDAGWYRGSEIDLTRFLREVVALALPVQPLCREDCQGLCPRCGADRNVERCTCAEVASSSPFAVLRRLKPE